MKLPSLNRITVEQFPDVPQWGRAIVAQFNLTQAQLFTAIAGKLSYGENVQATLRDGIVFTTAADYTTNNTFTPITFPSSLGVRARECRIAQIVKNNNYSAIITGAIGCPNWFDNNGIITVNFISGLENSTEYKINFTVV